MRNCLTIENRRCPIIISYPMRGRGHPPKTSCIPDKGIHKLAIARQIESFGSITDTKEPDQVHPVAFYSACTQTRLEQTVLEIFTRMYFLYCTHFEGHLHFSNKGPWSGWSLSQETKIAKRSHWCHSVAHTMLHFRKYIRVNISKTVCSRRVWVHAL